MNTSDSKLKVLIFSPHPGVGGGVVNFTQILRRHLSNDIDADRFVVGQRPGRLGRVFRGIVPLYDAIRLAILLIARHHDVYHINPTFDPRSVLRDGLFLIVLGALRRKNILVFIHGWDDEYYNRLAIRPIWRSLFRHSYRRAAQVLVLASSFARKLEILGLAADRIQVATTMFDGDLTRGTSRRRTDQEVWILFLARFVAGKGIYELLDAFKAINQWHSESVLIMAGDGPERQAARDWCRTHNLADSVRFPGYVGGSEKAQLLLDADIFALPSLAEGCPVSLLEAMGAGLPVIVTPVGGIPDIVRDGVNGIVIKASDSSEIAGALRRLIEATELRAKMGQHNREEAWRKYEAQRVAAGIEIFYRQLALN